MDTKIEDNIAKNIAYQDLPVEIRKVIYSLLNSTFLHTYNI